MEQTWQYEEGNDDDNNNNDIHEPDGIPSEMVNPFEKKMEAPLRPSDIRYSSTSEVQGDNRYTVVESTNFEAFGQEAEDFTSANDLENNKQLVGEFKIIFVGNVNVGKTSLIQRFVYNKFVKSDDSSVGQEECSKFLRLDQNSIVKLNLFDPLGAERYGTIPKQFYKDAFGVVVVYDITDRESFEKLDQWIKTTKDIAPNDVVFTIVGNKLDMASIRKVSSTDGSSFSQTNNASFFEVSAQTGNNVDLLFEDLANKIISKQSEIKEEDKVVRKEGRKSLSLDDVKKNKAKKERCCKK